MAKQLNVNLAFTADTGKAKQQIQDLQNQLTKFLNQPMSGFGDALTKDIKEASKAAAELKVHLEKATNPNTGTLDFSKLNQSMKQANTSVSQYAAKIRDMGPEGQKSFMMLAQSVAAAEVPIRRSNALLDEMWTTMKNTMRWQISSSILHGFMGAISSATGYAKDLNESLNNIRIVTGQSVDQMAKFAENANKAAKALSTTTTEYTNAALIYYQQGLSDKDVLARTDITVKMANVAGESAQKVSDQLTAVWNNFYDGSKSLEYYADVMTALGAATASSTDEISEGLNKFAAVAETVGLSYEYAASALATVTATTRQSADVVGTAFKTLFARIQDLELGKTLDDGTSLGKYSAALAAVGVNIKDSNGGLKEMDQIVEEMASKWDTLSKDQQVSLAQTVAGVRQYTQLIAWMDNWDFMEENLATSYGSTGALQKQADIYEESWQAASDRVRAALEEIYATLIDDEAFIDILNAVEKIIKGFDTLIDAAGGLKGVLLVLGTVLGSVFSKQLAQGITNTGYNLMNLTEKGRQKVQEEKQNTLNELLKQVPKAGLGDSPVEATQAEVLRAQLISQQKLLANAKNLTEEEQKVLQLLLDQQKARGEAAIESAKQVAAARDERSEARFLAYGSGNSTSTLDEVSRLAKAVAEFELAHPNVDEFTEDEVIQYQNLMAQLNGRINQGEEGLQRYADSVRSVIRLEADLKTKTEEATITDLKNKTPEEAQQEANEAQKKAQEARQKAQEAQWKAEEIQKKADESQARAIKSRTSEVQAEAEAIENGYKDMYLASQEYRICIEAEEDAINAAEEAKTAKAEASRLATEALEAETRATKAQTEADKLGAEAAEEKAKIPDGFKISSQGFVDLATSALGVASAFSMLGSAWDSIGDPDLSGWEKFQTVSTSLIGTLPLMATQLSKLSKVAITTKGATLGQVAATTKLGSLGTKAFTALGGSATGAAAGVAALVPYLLAVAAAIGVIALGIHIWDEMTVSAKEAGEQIKEAAKSYKEIKQEIDSLDDSLTSVQDRIKELENMDSLSIIEEEELRKLKEEESILQNQYDIQKAIYDLKREELANEFITNSEIVAKQMSKKAHTSKGITFVDGVWKTADEIEEIINSEEERKRYGIDNESIEYWQTKVAELKAQEAKSKTEYQNEYLDIYLAEKQGFFAMMDKAREDGTLDLDDSFIQDSVNNIASMTKSLYGEDYYNEKVLGGSSIQRALNESGIDFDSIIANAYKENFNVSQDEIQAQILEVIKNNPDLMMDLYQEGAFENDVAEYQAEKISGQYESVSEKTNLSAIMSDERWSNGDLSYLAQIKGLERYKDITSEDVNELNSLFEELDQLKRPAIDAQGSSDAEAFGLDVEEFETYRELLRETTDEYDDNSIGLNKVAIANKRMEKGIKDLASDWEDLNEVLSDENAELEDVSTALAKVKGPLQNILNLSDEQFELLPESFAKDNWDLIQDVINGVEGSVDELRDKAGETILLNIEGVVDPNGQLNQQFAELHNIIAEFDAAADFEVGIALNEQDHAKFIENCNTLIQSAKMTSEQAKAYFASMGYDVELEEVQAKDTPMSTYSWYPLDDAATAKAGGVPQFKSSPETISVSNTTQATAYAIKTITPNGSYGGGVGVKTTAPSTARKTSGGGSSKPKTAKAAKKSDTVERYKEINDSIEDLQHNLDISNKKADALWGEARFKEMRKGIEILKQENKLLEEKAKLADAYLAEDAAALKKAASAAGINFTFNADGNISNYTAEMTKLWTQLDNTITSANRDGNVSDSEQERIDKLQEKVDTVKDAISQYEDTLKTKQDIDKEYLDNQKEIWDTNFDILTESLEHNLSFNEADLELIDYYLSKMENNMFKLAEAYTKLNEKSIEYSDNLDIQRKHYEDLTESFKNGEISEAQYKEALLESQSAIVDTLQSLLDLDKEMQEYYGNTLDKAAEEIDIYADKIDHLNSVLDHYNNIMDLAGKSKDYEAMATILEGQAENLHNQLQIAKEEYDMYKTQAEYWEEMMAAVDETDPAFEVYKKNWDAAVVVTNEAQDEMLSKTQEWAEAMKAVIENELADIGQTLEKSITGGTSFDELLTSMERANSLQEEYLTDTNKIYETNKLIRTAQQEIDKTTNTVAKNKLKQFINETNQLQEQTKLSEYELKIQQAKYDLIVAEIALEEAQQAKSMVRLTRDSEGNFGYVYTADQNQIDAAQQKLEDAQNNLYNIGLEGANDYSQKYAETMQEMYDTLQEIQTAFLNGEIATQEEYDRRMLQAKEYYFDKLKDFSNLYQVALTTDSRVVNDAWSSDFNDMIYKTEELKSAVNDYADQSAGILKEWADTVKETIDDSGLDDVNKAVSGIVSDSEKLTEVLSGEDGLISKLNEEIDKVKESTSEYALKRAEIQGLISDYEKLAEQVNADYDDKNITAPETTLPSENAASAPESATGPASKTSLGVGSAVKVKAGTTWYGNSYGGGSSGRARNGTILYINESGTHPYNIDGLGWVRKEDLESFKSGGYTGAWGSYGKLALLDEKELILNKGDTSNFLASMEVLERILSIIDLHSANAQLSGVLSAPGFNHMNERSIEQNVHIEASFPGVQDRNEIEEAFNNLINQASQYANRK